MRPERMASSIDGQVSPSRADPPGCRSAAALILAGVIDGLLAFGLLGIFLGQTVLAVTYKLLIAWLAEGGPRPTVSDATIRWGKVSHADLELVLTNATSSMPSASCWAPDRPIHPGPRSG